MEWEQISKTVHLKDLNVTVMSVVKSLKAIAHSARRLEGEGRAVGSTGHQPLTPVLDP